MQVTTIKTSFLTIKQLPFDLIKVMPHGVLRKTSFMKKSLALLCLSAFLTVGSAPAAVETNTAAISSISTELQSITEKVRTKAREGKRTEAELKEELQALDALIEKNKNQKNEEVAAVLSYKAMLALSAFRDEAKGKEILEQIKNNYPGTESSERAARTLEALRDQAESKKVFDSLVAGVTFPDFEGKDLEGKTLSIADYKGKVLLVDFWATWCPPCRQELPNVKKVYEAYKTKGFDVLGISLDNSEEELKTFLKENEMPWRQHYDGEAWKSKLVKKYGILGIPATFLLDGSGKIIAKGLRGEDLEKAVEKALSKTGSGA